MKILNLLILTCLALPPSWCAPVREEDSDVLDVPNLPDGVHNHSDPYRGARLVQNNEFGMGDIVVSGQVKGDDVSIGSQVDIDVETRSFQSIAPPTESADPQNGGRTCEDQRLGRTAETSLCNEDCPSVTETRFDDMILDEEQIAWLKRGLVNGEIDDLNVDENTNKLENNPQSGLLDNAVRDPNRLWPNNIVYYSFDETLTSDQEEMVRSTLSGLQTKLSSCLTFQENDQEKRIIVGTKGPCNCCSHVGYKENTQNRLYLANGCWSTATIEHEFLHAIGIYHHHSRVDRDQHVRIKFENIQRCAIKNFDKYNQETIYNYGLPYDYESVMHYADDDFRKYSGLKTIETIDPTKQDIIGESAGVSIGDVELVRRAYRCVPGPVDGSWSAWGDFSECSATCGDATKSRTRTCSDPAPANGGEECEGSGEETTSCDLSKCGP